MYKITLIYGIIHLESIFMEKNYVDGSWEFMHYNLDVVGALLPTAHALWTLYLGKVGIETPA